MHRIAFTMQLHPGFAEEYRRRHDALWPELQQLLQETGIRDYSIFLDESTLKLFAVLKAEDPARLQALPQHPVMQRWWRYMADIMAVHADQSPVQVPLTEIFYLP